MKRRLALGMVLLVLLWAPAARAQCSLTITSPLSFGTYTGTQMRSTTPYKVTCPGSWSIPMDAGNGVGATETLRYLTGPNGVELGYEIYQDAAYSVNWGNTASTEKTGSGNYNGTIYAQLNGGQLLGPPGTYTDTVSTATTNYFTLNVTISPWCTISANPLSFGTYSGTVANANTNLSVTCTQTTPYNIGLSAGSATGATVTNRMMTGPSGSQLHYSLYSNASYSTNWGNSAPTWVSGTGSGTAQTVTVYGQVPAGQYPRAGSYTDTIIATINY